MFSLLRALLLLLPLLLLLSSAGAQRFYPQDFNRFAPPVDNMPRYNYVAGTYQRHTGVMPEVVPGQGVRLGNDLNSFWLLCSSSNCGRGRK